MNRKAHDLLVEISDLIVTDDFGNWELGGTKEYLDDLVSRLDSYMDNFRNRRQFWTSKPPVAEAYQWDGSTDCIVNIQKNFFPYLEWEPSRNCPENIAIKTDDGWVEVEPNDWIVYTNEENFHRCSPDVFENLYLPKED